MPEPILRAEGLTARCHGAADLSSVSFSLDAGVLAALVGPDAWDKDALVDLLTGRRRPTQGTLRLTGRPITHLRGRARRRRGLAWSLRPPVEFATDTLVEAVALAISALRRPTPFDMLRRTPSTPTSAAALELLQLVGLGGRSGCAPHRLSAVERARLEIARLLVARPRLLLIDRLTSSLDDADREDLAQLLRHLADSGTAVLWVEDDAGLALERAEQIVALHHGRTLAPGALDAPMRLEALTTAFLGQPR